jgi:hypothetical protein
MSLVNSQQQAQAPAAPSDAPAEDAIPGEDHPVWAMSDEEFEQMYKAMGIPWTIPMKITVESI